jgi:hypothetical protein
MDRHTQGKGLEVVLKRFISWRSNRNGRGAIPENLWAMAIKLCTQYPVSKISNSLGLDYTKLKIKVLQARVLSNNSVRERSSFIEVKVPNPDPQEVLEKRNEYTIEFFRVDGSRMRIVTGDGVLLNNLSSLFLQSK